MASSAYIAIPCSKEERQRILETRRTIAQSKAASVEHPTPFLTLTCDVCRTSFDITKHTHHLQSKKHRQNAVRGQDASTSRTTSTKITPPSSTNTDGEEEDDRDRPWYARGNDHNCLFCPHTTEDWAANVTHMRSVHSFWIPDSTYLVDPFRLMVYLDAVIEHGDCLYCSSPEARAKGKTNASSGVDAATEEEEEEEECFRFEGPGAFRSAKDGRRHMIDKGHCRVALNTGAEIAIDGIYDFGPSAVAGNEDDDDDGTVVRSSTDDDGSSQRHDAPSRHLTVIANTVPSSKDTRRPRSSQVRSQPRRTLPTATTTTSSTPPAALTATIASLPPRLQKTLQRNRRTGLSGLVGLSRSDLTKVARDLDVATRRDAQGKTRAYVKSGVRFNAQRRVGGPSTKPKGATGFGLYYLNT